MPTTNIYMCVCVCVCVCMWSAVYNVFYKFNMPFFLMEKQFNGKKMKDGTWFYLQGIDWIEKIEAECEFDKSVPVVTILNSYLIYWLTWSNNKKA